MQRRVLIALFVTTAWLLAISAVLAGHTTSGVGPVGSVTLWGETLVGGVPVAGATVYAEYQLADGTPQVVEAGTGDTPPHYALAVNVSPVETSKVVTFTAVYTDGGTKYGAVEVVTLGPSDLWTAGGTTRGMGRFDLILDDKVEPHLPVVWGRANDPCTGLPVDGLLVSVFDPQNPDKPIVRPTTTDKNGEFEIDLRESQTFNGTYTVRITLADPHQRFALFEGRKESRQEAQPIWIEQTIKWDPTSRLASATVNFNVVPKDRTQKPGSTPRLPPTMGNATPWAGVVSYNTNASNPDYADDMLASYGHMQTVARWLADALGAPLPPVLRVNLFDTTVAASGYETATRTIHFTPADSSCHDPDRPMNREWHETFHDLMQVTMGIPPLAPGDDNHKGFANSSTADSWSEGWATGWTLIMASDLGGATPTPGLYPVSGAMADLEFDWQPRDPMTMTAGCAPPVPTFLSREEFAVAGLLYDLYDSAPVDKDGKIDNISVTPKALWDALRPSPSIGNVLELYRRLTGSAPALGISQVDLNQLFINHGLYADLNDSCTYDAGERIGQVADMARPARRDVPPQPGAAMDLSIAAGAAPTDTVLLLWVAVTSPDHRHDSLYNVPLTGDKQRIALEPLPPRSGAIMRLWVISQNGAWRSEPRSIPTTKFWEAAATAPPGEAALRETFELRRQLYLPLLRR
ncbi:MAG: carboxypeptidase-like regulatory domain-containing protein [Ardenticatenaceae bacterium]|nr:carboxypeptidase-like regulatory domain-containing protein [Ardenticatenaceae bacterium]